MASEIPAHVLHRTFKQTNKRETSITQIGIT
jgi:hypothetical protein